MLAASTTYTNDVQQVSQDTQGPLCPHCQSDALTQISPVRGAGSGTYTTHHHQPGHVGMPCMQRQR